MKVAALLVALACASCGVRAQAPATRPPQKYEALARQILSELISIDTTVDKGSTVAAKAVAARAIAAGFPQADVAVVTPKERPDSSSAVIRLRGRSSGPTPVLYIDHLDVVPARREDWTFDPFRLTEKDGWLYGRGTIDMKGQDAAVLTSLIRLKQEGVVPSRDIVVAFTPDEETRSQWGVGYLLKDRIGDITEFVEAVDRVHAGQTVVDPEVVAQLLGRRRDPLTRLTPREREVLALMAEGRSNAAIAGALFVSEKAVAKHTNSIFTKLDLPPCDDDNRRVLAVLAHLGVQS